MAMAQVSRITGVVVSAEDNEPIVGASVLVVDLAAPNFGVQEWSGIEPPNFVIQDLKGPKGALLEVFYRTSGI